MPNPYFPGPKNRLLTTFRLLRQPFEVYPAWVERYGDPVLLPAVNGDVVLTGQPELIKTIFSAPPETYGVFGAEAAAPVVGAQSLFTMEGTAHKRDRKLLMPPFHGQRVRAYATTMQEVARRHFDRVVEAGGGTDMLSLAQAITLEIIVRAVVGESETDRVEGLGRALIDAIEAAHPAFLFAPFLQREFGGVGPWAQFRRKLERGDVLMQERIDAARREEPGEDVLSMMIAARYDDGSTMSDTAIRDELRTMLVAGHETTAITLAFLVDFLFRDPAECERLRADAVATAGDPTAQSKLASVQGAVRETLRMRPPLTEALRTLNQPFTLAGVELPPGVVVSPSAILAHLNPEVFPEPERFRPARFEEKNFTPFEYLPFGGGHRRCIGAAFAEVEMKIVVATLLAEYEVELEGPPAEVYRRNITIAPRGGVPLRIRRRKAMRSAA
ncbi:MAG: cytochrome P450 [Myxococcota bacterium]